MARWGSKAFRPYHELARHRIFVLASLAFLLLTSLFLIRNKDQQVVSSSNSATLKWNSFESSIHLYPTLDNVNGTEVISQIPEYPKAILFLAHGCNGKALNFWDRSPNCPSCIGLPEERLIVLQALYRKFAVLAITSSGRCWSLGKERKKVGRIIRWWIGKNKLGELPVMGLGASSGGYFVSAFALDMRFSSISVMIHEGIFDSVDIPENYPPTLFVHMPKDKRRAHLIDENIRTLTKKGIDVSEVKCFEFPLNPYFLSNRIPGLDHKTSNKLFDFFLKKGFLDNNGYMKNDGRSIHWKKAVKEAAVLPDNYEWIHHIEEELNLAFAFHEMTSLPSSQILDWFESHMS